MLHRGEAPARGGEHVDARDVELRVVAGAAHALLLQLVECRFEDVRAIAEALHADRALRLHVAHPAARLLRACVIGASGRKKTYGKMRGAVISFAALRSLFARAPFDAVAAARIADRRDAVAHPELVDVLGRHALILAADVAVHVDQPGQHVVSAQVDLAPARLRASAASAPP